MGDESDTLTYTSWFALFDGMYSGTAKVNNISSGIDQGRPSSYKQKSVHALSYSEKQGTHQGKRIR